MIRKITERMFIYEVSIEKNYVAVDEIVNKIFVNIMAVSRNCGFFCTRFLFRQCNVTASKVRKCVPRIVLD